MNGEYRLPPDAGPEWRAAYEAVLDICCPFGEQNVRRIEAAVKDLHPFHRLTANKLPLEMTRSAYGEFRFLDLDALIASKKAAGRERDLAAVRYLLAIKERNARH